MRKPGAFARYRYREELFPTLLFRRAYDALRQGYDVERKADIEYVRILHLAASTCQADVETALELALEGGGTFDCQAVKALVAPQRSEAPTVAASTPDLSRYDGALTAVAK